MKIRDLLKNTTVNKSKEELRETVTAGRASVKNVANFAQGVPRKILAQSRYDAVHRGIVVEDANSEEEIKLTEALPAIPFIIKAAAPALASLGARILAGAGRGAAATPGAVAQVGRGVGAAGTGIGIGAAGLAVNDIVQMAKQGIESLSPIIESVLGSEALKKIISFSSKYGLPILAAVAILYGGKKVIDFLRKKGESIGETATAGGTGAGSIASSTGFVKGIGSKERAIGSTKKKSKLIKR
jgi:hypothetical protein